MPDYQSRPTRHVVVVRVASGHWQERARFTEAVDADQYATRLRAEETDVANAVGWETMVFVDDRMPSTLVPSQTIDELDLNDQRVRAWPKFDA